MSNENATEMVQAQPAKQLSFAERKRLLKVATGFNSVWDEIKNGGKLTINCINYMHMPTTQNDMNTGEVVDKTRYIFIDENGDSWSTTSAAVEASMNLFENLMGNPATWDEPVKVTFRKQQSKRGMEFTAIEFD